ncbi:hypothetical protein [Leifsonia poae]|uniref:hypothetical protein n=1 Tax=Leifsonia poae TaxID=110933 RepID=UPI003D67B2D1
MPAKFASQFEAKGDTLRTAVGADYKAKTKAGLSATASLAYTNEVPKDRTIAMATNDSGAIVWTNLNEFETTKVVEAGAEITLKGGGAAEALLGANASKTGIQITYGYQLAFFVPPAGSDQKIRLLGFAQGIIGAKEV